MAKSHLSKTLTALSGEFLVAGQLCLRGYVASLTLKNYPGVDIFCLNPNNSKQAAIQVKTTRGGNAYYVPKKNDAYKNPFVFVYIKDDGSIDYYVVPAKNVAKLSAKQTEDYLKKNPHVSREQPRMLSITSIKDYKDKWNLLRLD